MKEIEKFAQNISNNVQNESNQYGSITITMMVISIIISTLRLMNECNLFGGRLENRIKNPGRWDRLLLRKAIKNKLPADQSHLRDKIYEQIVLQSQGLSSGQIQIMLKEAKNER